MKRQAPILCIYNNVEKQYRKTKNILTSGVSKMAKAHKNIHKMQEKVCIRRLQK